MRRREAVAAGLRVDQVKGAKDRCDEAALSHRLHRGHDHDHDGDADLEIVWIATRALRDQPAHEVLAFFQLLPEPGAQRGNLDSELCAGQDDVPVTLEDPAHLLEHVADGDAERLVSRSIQQELADDRVVGVIEDNVFLAGKAGEYANLVTADNHGRNWGTWIGAIKAS